MGAKEALLSATHLPHLDLLLIPLRLTFGGRACPPEWCAIAEMVTDLANAILQDPNWDPLELFNKDSLKIPAGEELDESIAFGEGRDLVVDVPVNPRGQVDDYIDDLITLNLDLPGSDYNLRSERAVLLAIEVVARKIDSEEPIPRELLTALKKLIAEARPEELKIILGWLYNFRELIVSLPFNKSIAWSEAISAMLADEKVEAKVLESNIGRWVNVGMILPYVHHFLARMRTLLKKAKKRQSAVTIPEEVCLDLELMDTVINSLFQAIIMALNGFGSTDSSLEASLRSTKKN